MRRFLFLVFAFSTTLLIWVTTDFSYFDKSLYVSQNMLDIAVPFDGTIDTDFIRSLNPAYEQ